MFRLEAVYWLFKRAGVIGSGSEDAIDADWLSEPMSTMQTTPNWVWLLLVGAVFGVSSAGTIFQQVTMFLHCRASWRLQLTSSIGASSLDSMV